VNKKITAITDLTLKWATILGIVAAGAWAFLNFWLMRLDVPNLVLTPSTETIPYTDNLRLLVIHIKPKNIGKVVFEPGKKGFHLLIKKLPKSAKYGELLEFAKAKTFKTVDLLRNDPDGYTLEPGAEYDEVESLVASAGDIFYIEAELWWSNDQDSVMSKIVVRVN
jgi:hypothetical protein